MITEIQLAAILGGTTVTSYFLGRIVNKKKTFAINHTVLSFVSGMTLFLCYNLFMLGFNEECNGIERAGHTSMMIGAFALAVIAGDGLRKLIVTDNPGDPNYKNGNEDS